MDSMYIKQLVSVVVVDVVEFIVGSLLVTVPDLLAAVSVEVAGQVLAALLVGAPALALVALPRVQVAVVEEDTVAVAA